MKPIYCNQGHDNPPGTRFCCQCGEKLSPAIGNPISVGMMLDDRYIIVGELGHGGFGRTYLAQDTNRFKELCVLKEFAPQVQGTYALQKAEELFQREAGVLYHLQHPQIPKFRELCRSEINGIGHIFLVQDYVEGQTYRGLLTERIRQGLRLTEVECHHLLIKILPVLEYIHSLGVVHRDISPDNLILRKSDGLPVLIDFGGVKQVAATIASELQGIQATRLGKVGYVPDEQMSNGMVYPHSDLYALGVTVLVLLTGKEPQGLRDPYDLSWKWREEVSLSLLLGAVLDKMVAYQPSDRYQSARQALEALTGSLSLPKQSAPIIPPNRTKAAIAIPNQRQSPSNVTTPPSTGILSGCSKFLVILLLMLGAAWGGWWGTNQWLYFRSHSQKKAPDLTNQTENTTAQPLPEYSPEEQERKQTIIDRSREMKLDFSFFNRLVNQVFYANNPQLDKRALTSDSADTQLREDWDQIAIEMLDKLAFLSPESRQRLSNYTSDDSEDRRKRAYKLHLSSPSLNHIADAKFFSLFPEQRGQNFINQPIGQVWHAIASDCLTGMENGKMLQEIKFPPDQTSVQLSGQLEPGAGKVYIADLQKGQFAKFQLDRAKEGIKLSIYPPSGNNPLLEDSNELNWSEELRESGYYEFTIVSEAENPIDYQLTLKANQRKSNHR